MLLKKPLDKNKKIAFVFSPQLGDSLISMVVVHNLRRNGYDVTVFSDHIFAMQSWFANDKIQPYPQKEAVKATLSEYDALIFLYPHDMIAEEDLWHSNIIILGQSPLTKAPKSIVDSLVDVCREELHLVDLVRVNDLTPPAELEHHKHHNRVIIHPTSREFFRSWHKEKFIKLARKLKVRGFIPVFIVAPSEYSEWMLLEKEKLRVPKFSSLNEVASYVYESGWFIGNDSGIGHLSSNLGLSTVTVAVRPGVARLWHPSWTPGVVIMPPKWLITRKLKEKFWRNFISVSKVLRVCLAQSWVRKI